MAWPRGADAGALSLGSQYPKDMYRIIGSGVNTAFIVPSLDLIATLNRPTPNKLRDEIVRTFLQKLFAGVTQQYTVCDGRIMNPLGSVPCAVTRLTRLHRRRVD